MEVLRRERGRLPGFQNGAQCLHHLLAYELRATPFKVNAVCPGYVDTDFTDHLGDSSPREAAARVLQDALLGPDGPTGQFFGQEAGTDRNPW